MFPQAASVTTLSKSRIDENVFLLNQEQFITSKATYIGETSRSLTTRLKKKTTKKGELNSNIAEQNLKTSHTIDWDSASWVPTVPTTLNDLLT